MIREALRRHRAFNVIHLASAYKFDLFPLNDSPYDREQFARRRFASLQQTGGRDVEFAVASPEDTILSKLVWFRDTGGTSERQWNDIRGVARSQGSRLEMAYLAVWADRLGPTFAVGAHFGAKLSGSQS